MDEIRIIDLEVFAHHGVFEEENKLGQKFLVCATLYLDTHQAGTTDDLEFSVNYGEVCHFITNFMKNHTCKLIETVAELLCEEILKNFIIIQKISLEVKKPWAPILLPLKEVSIKIERAWHTVYLGLGSNIGNKEGYLNQAIQELKQDNTIKDIKVSKYIQTKPIGYVEQEDFLNACIGCVTLYSPQDLLKVVNEIESNAKRERKIHWGPRTLDIDILFYDDKIIDSECLTIPHKELHKRDFVLKPMLEIAPYYRHPIFNKTIVELCEEKNCDSKTKTVYL